MKKIKLLQLALGFALVGSLAGCGSKEADTAVSASAEATVLEATTEAAAAEAATTEAAIEATTDAATTTTGDTVLFEDSASGLSVSYPSAWTPESATLGSALNGLDATMLLGVEAPQTGTNLGVFGVYKLNMDLGTGDAFKTTADTMAQQMFSKEAIEAMIPAINAQLEAQGMSATTEDIQALVPMDINGNTFYRTSLRMKISVGSVSETGSYEYIVGGANDQFLIFMGISTDTANFDAVNAIIDSISFK